MIIQSPESGMPEPFRTYVKQRNESITRVLQDIVSDTNVQLCPRAITPDERFFSEDNGCVYGAVVKKTEDGYKSILYSDGFGSNGIATSNFKDALAYTTTQFQKGNRVRVKDPRESDSQGQYTIESIDQLVSIFNEMNNSSEFGCVLMPFLAEITERVSVGRINLGEFGSFTYFGREETTLRDNAQVYGGTALGLFRSGTRENEAKVEKHFEISPKLTNLGKVALDKYSRIAVSSGRVSVDVIEGITDSGEILCDVIDLTPRVGGTTPAETLAIREINRQNSLCFVSSKLIYNPTLKPKTGINFIDTDSLVINAQIHEVLK